MKIYDITLPLQPGLASWPGDTPYEFSQNAAISEGDSVNLGSISMSVHTGTHTDAPRHFFDSGITVENMDLNAFLGPCVVVDVRGKSLITASDLENLDLRNTPRVLFKTNAWTVTTIFPTTFPLLHEALPAHLKALGVVLVGLDVPSVDAMESKELAIHHALHDCGITILESLRLQEVPPGVYELIALPLKLVGADGAPVRAILKKR